MPSANKTPNYNLTQYSNNGSDKISALKDYNEDMSKIDTALNQNANNIVGKADKTYVDTQYNALQANVDAEATARGDADKTLQGNIDKKANITDIPKTNVLYYGIDNTGETDISEQIVNLSKNVTGLYFPDGKYLINNTITINCSLTASPGAFFFTNTNIDTMLVVHGNESRHIVIQGGFWDGANKTNTIIKSDVGNDLVIRSVELVRAADTHLDLSEAHAAFVNDVKIDGFYKNVTGIKTNYDSQFSNMRIFGCATEIKTQGTNMFSNVYLWGGGNQANRKTVGFSLAPGSNVIFSNLYLDSLQNGFYAESSGKNIIKGSALNVYAEPADLDPSIQSILFNLNTNDILDISSPLYKSNRAMIFSSNVLDSGHFGDANSFFSDFAIDKFSDFNHYFSAKNTDILSKWIKPYTALYTLPSQQAVKVATLTGDIDETINVRSIYGDIKFIGVNAKMNIYSYGNKTNINSHASLWKVVQSDGKTSDIYLKNDSTADKTNWGYAVMLSEVFQFGGDSYINMRPIPQTLPGGAIQINLDAS
jgi:hypothetical protein